MNDVKVPIGVVEALGTVSQEQLEVWRKVDVRGVGYEVETDHFGFREFSSHLDCPDTGTYILRKLEKYGTKRTYRYQCP